MRYRVKTFQIIFFLLAPLIWADVSKPGPEDAKPTSPASIMSLAAPIVLDQKKIHAIYLDGEFEAVIASIDTFTRANSTYSKTDSIFIAKHLAVVYTANPATRERGKNYMFRLLDLLPTVKILDMFVSDEIDRIFEKVREEYVLRGEYLGKDSSLQLPAKLEKKENGSHKLYWISGGAAIVAAVATVVYLQMPAKAEDKVYDVPTKK